MSTPAENDGGRTALRVALAVLIGGGIEAALLGIINANAPDPPLDAYDIVMMGSQMPGLLLIGALASTASVSSRVGFVTGFIIQGILYILLVNWLLGFVFRRRERPVP